MKLIYLKSALKCDSFDVAIDIKIQFFRVLVPIEPDRSLLQFVTTNCLITKITKMHTLFTLNKHYQYTFRINLNSTLCELIGIATMYKTYTTRA